MGASTAMMYSKSDAVPVAGLILDSGFADFKEVAKSTVLKFGIPEPFVDMLWPQMVEKIAETTGGMDLNSLRPIDHCPSRSVPALFVHGVDDDLIPMDHSERNFEVYGCG